MAKQKENKAMTGAERVAKSVKVRKDAGLIQIKVWVIDQRGEDLKGVKSEADRTRDYAAKQPITKTILNSLND